MSSQIVGTLEISRLLGVSRQRADQLTKSDPMFPRPVAELASGRVWEWEGVRVWALFRDRLKEGSEPLASYGYPMDAILAVTEAARVLLASPTKKSAQRALREALAVFEAL